MGCALLKIYFGMKEYPLDFNIFPAASREGDYLGSSVTREFPTVMEKTT